MAPTDPTDPFVRALLGLPAQSDNPFASRNSLANLGTSPPRPSGGLFGLSPFAATQDNPFAPRNSRLDNLRESPPAPPTPRNVLFDLAFPPSQPFGSLAPGRSWLDKQIPTPPPAPKPRPPLPVAPTIKRKAFFSFHFEDSFRVNNVRNAWKITHPESALMRSFYDSSLWERRKLEGDEAIKRLIREGVGYTSAVAVLVGSETWVRRWVRYEIARAVIDQRGLLAININGIKHHKALVSHARGPNPLDFMAIGKVIKDGAIRYHLFEKRALPDGQGGWGFGWDRYEDYTSAINRPTWVNDPAVGYVTPLSRNADLYDYVTDNGHRNIGAWIDRAAKRSGR